MPEKLLSSALLKVLHSENPEDYRSAVCLNLEGSNEISFMDGEPEDANLNRDFSDVYQIAEMIEYANQLGLDGVKIITETEDVSWDEI